MIGHAHCTLLCLCCYHQNCCLYAVCIVGYSQLASFQSDLGMRMQSHSHTISIQMLLPCPPVITFPGLHMIADWNATNGHHIHEREMLQYKNHYENGFHILYTITESISSFRNRKGVVLVSQVPFLYVQRNLKHHTFSFTV